MPNLGEASGPATLVCNGVSTPVHYKLSLWLVGTRLWTEGTLTGPLEAFVAAQNAGECLLQIEDREVVAYVRVHTGAEVLVSVTTKARAVRF